MQDPTNEHNLSEHQFGGQGTLFDAPLGQEEAQGKMGKAVIHGNPNARLYRMVMVPNHLTTPEQVMEHASRPGTDGGHARSLGIHWQHDLALAHDLADQGERDEWGGFGTSETHHAAILEADHPGKEHVIDFTPMPGGGPPDDLAKTPRHKRTGYNKDWSLITDTVGPHDLHGTMLPEVPVRPGAPMTVHAVHLPDHESSVSGARVRNPVQFKGFA